MKIEEAIQQKKFRDEYHKAHINVLFTASWIHQQSLKALKPFNISWQQFNILRILRGMYPEPASVKSLTERMIDKMSNASRLVEKLKQKGLVERRSCKFDRRQVDVVITDQGLELLSQASAAMEDQMDLSKSQLSEEQAAQLNDLLDAMRY
ncbi:MarR family winged helix-turn-helix transcriptional regulator [Flavilitoribacter nigricans]|uniref:MarR family transcriptional regulator n=1 Tax=Flavilitoribacter nigricans (strain ATCC 23147 / DSM 23189 / NBRC 102662 / NCIMB 1420 / SS-2) TaxID=1122177 RepID=A0A2D0MZ41_FLAN2|nr:MarR family transcriptional regulator [Flavilitoribacter nigricans]PHN01544.1 MarR family transcriptional regulator [Flavilitoribacter nigricans DSM 23189 = NBRC 102662]